ncbi:MAG TPA: DegT/DnrJ/EryC1/StrS family aminotransferase, partial [Polyangiales bacterium]|nr:DegT/DnrJ/EryC1/StrS family aminotransferase [Polyangiales bacterium]
SNTFILGPEVEAFEREVAAQIGVAHAIGVSSGTDALLMALMALGVGPGDEVIMPPFTFFATAGCVARLGARPVFVDIDPRTFNIDVSRIAEKITPRTKAIVPVHLYGQAADLEALAALAAKTGVAIIEDAAQALGSRSTTHAVGSVGTFGCFSFFPSKNLGALGDGGLLTTNDAAQAKHARLLRTHGSEPKYFHALVGGNFRLDALQAAFLRAKLPYLQRWTDGRRANAALYDQLFAAARLPAELLTTPTRVYEGHVYNQYVIRSSRRDALLAHLKANGIGSEVYYPLPMHLQACFAYLGESTGAYPHAERAAREVLALPIYAELGRERIERVVGHVVDFLRS